MLFLGSLLMLASAILAWAPTLSGGSWTAAPPAVVALAVTGALLVIVAS
jgi:hypothetical protein